MLENILPQLPYYFGIAGVALVILGLLGIIFLGNRHEGSENWVSPGVSLILLAVVLYFTYPYIIQFLNTLKK